MYLVTFALRRRCGILNTNTI